MELSSFPELRLWPFFKELTLNRTQEPAIFFQHSWCKFDEKNRMEAMEAWELPNQNVGWCDYLSLNNYGISDVLFNPGNLDNSKMPFFGWSLVIEGKRVKLHDAYFCTEWERFDRHVPRPYWYCSPACGSHIWSSFLELKRGKIWLKNSNSFAQCIDSSLFYQERKKRWKVFAQTLLFISRGRLW